MALIFERSPDTNAVAVVLRGCNDEITYQQLAKQSGLDLLRMKSVLHSARKIVRNEHGILFGTIIGEGLRRLTDVDKVKKPESFKKRVFRAAGRELKDQETIADFEALSKADQHRVSTNRIVLSALRQQAAVRPEPPPQKPRSPTPTPNVAALARMK